MTPPSPKTKKYGTRTKLLNYRAKQVFMVYSEYITITFIYM